MCFLDRLQKQLFLIFQVKQYKMDLTRINIIFVLLLQYLFIFTHQKAQFEKIVWIYWEGEIKDASLAVNLCVQKFQATAQKQNWTLNILDDTNLEKFIPKYQTQYLDVLKMSERNSSAQAKSDLIRLNVLQQHGGVWFDISILLLNDYSLQWIHQVDKYFPYILNAVSQNPEVLMFTFSEFQSIGFYKSFTGKVYNEYPGFEMWFIAAVKKSELIRDWKKTYINFTTTGYKTYHKWIVQEDVFMKTIDTLDSYFSGNMALVYCLNRKQKQLDRNTNIFSRQTVYDHYKLWGIPGQLGPHFAVNNFGQIIKLFVKTKQQLSHEFNGQPMFFIKLNGGLRQNIEMRLRALIEKVANKNMDFQKLYASHQAYVEDCFDLKFIVQGSIIYEFLSAERRQNYKAIIINKQQRQRWQAICKRKLIQSREQDKIKRQNQFVQQKQQTQNQRKVRLQKLQDKFQIFKDQGLFQLIQELTKGSNPQVLKYPAPILSRAKLLRNSLQSLIKTYFKAHFFLITEWLEKFYFSSGIFLKWIGIYFFTLFFIKLLQLLVKTLICKDQTILKIAKKVFCLDFQDKKFEDWQVYATLIIVQFVSVFWKILLVSLGQFLYFSCSFLGLYPLDSSALFFVVLLLAFGKLDRKMTERAPQRLISKNYHALMQAPIYFYLAYLTVSLFLKRQEWIIYNSILLGLVAPCLLQICISLKKMSQVGPVLQIINKGKGNYDKIVFSVILAANILPNIRHLQIFDQYIGSAMLNVIKFIMALVALAIAVRILKMTIKMITSKFQTYSSPFQSSYESPEQSFSEGSINQGRSLIILTLNLITTVCFSLFIGFLAVSESNQSRYELLIKQSVNHYGSAYHHSLIGFFCLLIFYARFATQIARFKHFSVFFINILLIYPYCGYYLYKTYNIDQITSEISHGTKSNVQYPPDDKKSQYLLGQDLFVVGYLFMGHLVFTFIMKKLVAVQRKHEDHPQKFQQIKSIGNSQQIQEFQFKEVNQTEAE